MRQLCLDPAWSTLIRHAAPLHDVGKVGIPDSILLKPAKLTPGEFEIVRGHAAAVGKILDGSKSDLLQLAQEIAVSHHEWWDGSGFPHRLAGEQIPLSGRIVAVADVFDALTHERPYKQAWTVTDSVREVHRLSGSQFDPAVIEAFQQLNPDHLAGRTPLEAPRRLRAVSLSPLVAGTSVRHVVAGKPHSCRGKNHGSGGTIPEATSSHQAQDGRAGRGCRAAASFSRHDWLVPGPLSKSEPRLASAVLRERRGSVAVNYGLGYDSPEPMRDSCSPLTGSQTSPTSWANHTAAIRASLESKHLLGDHLTTFSGTYLESGKPFVYALSHAGIAPSPCAASSRSVRSSGRPGCEARPSRESRRTDRSTQREPARDARLFHHLKTACVDLLAVAYVLSTIVERTHPIINLGAEIPGLPEESTLRTAAVGATAIGSDEVEARMNAFMAAWIGFRDAAEELTVAKEVAPGQPALPAARELVASRRDGYRAAMKALELHGAKTPLQIACCGCRNCTPRGCGVGRTAVFGERAARRLRRPRLTSTEGSFASLTPKGDEQPIPITLYTGATPIRFREVRHKPQLEGATPK